MDEKLTPLACLVERKLQIVEQVNQVSEMVLQMQNLLETSVPSCMQVIRIPHIRERHSCVMMVNQRNSIFKCCQAFKGREGKSKLELHQSVTGICNKIVIGVAAFHQSKRLELLDGISDFSVPVAEFEIFWVSVSLGNFEQQPWNEFRDQKRCNSKECPTIFAELREREVQQRLPLGLSFFHWICGMESQEIENRARFVIDETTHVRNTHRKATQFL